MTSHKIAPSSASAAVAARIVRANPGATVEDVARIARRSVTHTGGMLRAAEKAGLIGALHMSRALAQWFPGDQIAAIRAAERARRAQVKRERNAGYRAKGAPDAQQDEPPDELLTVVQRQAPAGSPLPFKVCAPRSVFEWGRA